MLEKRRLLTVRHTKEATNVSLSVPQSESFVVLLLAVTSQKMRLSMRSHEPGHRYDVVSFEQDLG